jgi:8-oxo-dGTP pyrophosphatase MutT (NUDIX family)
MPQNYLTLLRDFQPRDPGEAADLALTLDCCRLWGDRVLTREALAAHITSSGFVMSPDLQWVLMAWHNIYRSWAWTGGHADGDPDLLGVALREAAEETSVAGLRPLSPAPLSLEVIPVPRHQKRGREVSPHLHLNLSFVLLAPREGQSLREKPDENSGVAWLPAGRLEDYCTEPEMLPIYRRLIQRAREL